MPGRTPDRPQFNFHAGGDTVTARRSIVLPLQLKRAPGRNPVTPVWAPRNPDSPHTPVIAPHRPGSPQRPAPEKPVVPIKAPANPRRTHES